MAFKDKKKGKEYNKWRYREIKKGSWTTSRRSIYKLWTKEEIRKVIDMWEDKTMGELCAILGRNKGSIMHIATAIRKQGYKLPKKMTRVKTDGLIQEVIREMRAHK